MSPSDRIRFALNFDALNFEVVFPPVLGITAETSYTHHSAASLPHLFALC